MKNYTYVQYGCGWSVPETDGWRHFDASPTLFFERIPVIGKLYARNKSRFPDHVEFGDIVRGLPVDTQSLDGVYCSHVLEHLSLSDFRVAIENTHRMLRPGGLFRLVLPDLEYMVSRYVNDPSQGAALRFMDETGLGFRTRERSLARSVVSWLGNSRHLWMWDFDALEPELEREGFTGIRRASFGDSPDPMFRQVEEQEKWKNHLGIECWRPQRA